MKPYSDWAKDFDLPNGLKIKPGWSIPLEERKGKSKQPRADRVPPALDPKKAQHLRFKEDQALFDTMLDMDTRPEVRDPDQKPQPMDEIEREISEARQETMGVSLADELPKYAKRIVQTQERTGYSPTPREPATKPIDYSKTAVPKKEHMDRQQEKTKQTIKDPPPGKAGKPGQASTASGGAGEKGPSSGSPSKQKDKQKSPPSTSDNKQAGASTTNPARKDPGKDSNKPGRPPLAGGSSGKKQ